MHLLPIPIPTNEDSQECCAATNELSNALGKAWKKLLKKTDAELGIDKGEFSRFFILFRICCVKPAFDSRRRRN